MVVVSAHWEEPVSTVMTSPRPPLLYDYGGFPPETYRIAWPAPGAPQLAARVRALLEGAGFPTAEDAERGFDHGTFVPLKLAFPEADVPAIQLSLVEGLDPERHLALGRALAPLRDEDVLLVGSGMSYHNMRDLLGRAPLRGAGGEVGAVRRLAGAGGRGGRAGARRGARALGAGAGRARRASARGASVAADGGRGRGRRRPGAGCVPRDVRRVSCERGALRRGALIGGPLTLTLSPLRGAREYLMSVRDLPRAGAFLRPRVQSG